MTRMKGIWTDKRTHKKLFYIDGYIWISGCLFLFTLAISIFNQILRNLPGPSSSQTKPEAARKSILHLKGKNNDGFQERQTRWLMMDDI